jgi:ATP synthase protein I
MEKWRVALRLIGIGWYVAIAILSGLLAGVWLDGLFGTRPLFIVIGLLLGIVLAFFGFYKLILPMLDTKKDRTK